MEASNIGIKVDCFVEERQSIFVLLVPKPPQTEIVIGVGVLWVSPYVLKKATNRVFRFQVRKRELSGPVNAHCSSPPPMRMR